ncbi:MAG: ABC transporter substrate-binding protein [Verrucomicrobiota bacterium]
MKLNRIFNAIGFTLIGVCFLISAYRMFSRSRQETHSNITTIRFSHWQLEAGVREAFDLLTQEYMKMHPNVRVIQEPVPEKVYTNWLITQLIGETAPDLIWIGQGMNDERLARYFVPLTTYVNEPNPYNQGTDLEKIAWRDTYLDGMQGSYNQNLLEYYSASNAMHVVRLFYNQELLKKISGLDAPPNDYEAFIRLCDQIRDYSQKTGSAIIPIAGSQYNARMMLTPLFSTQMQKMIFSPSAFYSLRPEWSGGLATDYWNKAWTLEAPEIRSGLQLMHEMGRNMQPGFLQLQREDATFYFVQQRAVMIASGSWDSSGIHQETKGLFHVGIAPLPIPSSQSPKFSKYVLGPVSEANLRAAGGFGIPRCSKSFEVALDFQRFTTSRMGNQIFVDRSGWLPVIRGVNIPEELKPFQPRLEGYPDAFNFAWQADTKRVVDNSLDKLYSVSGGVDSFIEALKPNYGRAIADDFRSNIRTQYRNTLRIEVSTEGLKQLLKLHPEETKLEAKAEEMTEVLNMVETDLLRSQYYLREAGYEGVK